MSSFEVVVVDVFWDFPQGIFDRGVARHFQFRLQPPEARFHERVVVAIVGPIHALKHAGTSEYPTILMRCVLTSSIGVVNQLAARLPAANRHPQGTDDQAFFHVQLQAPAHNPPRI